MRSRVTGASGDADLDSCVNSRRDVTSAHGARRPSAGVERWRHGGRIDQRRTTWCRRRRHSTNTTNIIIY